MPGTIDVSIDLGDLSFLPKTIMVHVTRTESGDCPEIDVYYTNTGIADPDYGFEIMQVQSSENVNADLLPLCDKICPKPGRICSDNALPLGFRVTFPANFCAGNSDWSFLAGNSYDITDEYFTSGVEGYLDCTWNCFIFEDGTVSFTDSVEHGHRWRFSISVNPISDGETLTSIASLVLNTHEAGAGDISLVYYSELGPLDNPASTDPDLNPLFADSNQVEFSTEDASLPECGSSDPIIIEPIA